MLLYFVIFFSKIIENTLSTLRIILVANRKKLLGAILQGVVALVWIFVTGVVIIDVGKDPLKVLFFCLGTIIGSYLGSIIEEKIALGSIFVKCFIKNKHCSKVQKILENNSSKIIIEQHNNFFIFSANVKRKKINYVCDYVKKIDPKSVIIIENSKKIV